MLQKSGNILLKLKM